MAYNTTASLDKLTCTDYVDFSKRQGRFGQFLWSKNDSICLDVKLNVLKKDDKKEILLVQKFAMGAADFNQFMRLTNQLVNAAENFGREESLTSVLIPPMSKFMDEHLKLAHKVIDVMDRANRKNLCNSAAWTSLRVLMLKSEYLQGTRRTRSFNKLSMWIINLKNLSFYFM